MAERLTGTAESPPGAGDPLARLTPRAREIVLAARALVAESGPAALTMRALADHLGIKAPSLYKHFPDKAAVEAEVIALGLLETAEALEAAERSFAHGDRPPGGAPAGPVAPAPSAPLAPPAADARFLEGTPSVPETPPATEAPPVRGALPASDTPSTLGTPSAPGTPSMTDARPATDGPSPWHVPAASGVPAAATTGGAPRAGTLLEALADAYRRDALAHPHLYLLATERPLPRHALPDGLEERAALPLMRACGFDVDRARAVWAFAHGMVSLEIHGRFPDGADLAAAWSAGVRALEY
ncbi:TetR family transcriptional regulator [Streptomyces sp. JNUCC 64]